MIVKHFLSDTKKIERSENERVGFLLSNSLGDYFWQGGGGLPLSRYEGWFCRLSGNLYRIIECLDIEGGDVSEVVNRFSSVLRKRDDLKETFFLSKEDHVMILELNQKRSVRVFFDVKESYSSNPGDNFSVKAVEEGKLLVEFESGISLAIQCEYGREEREEVVRSYEYDKNRNSAPFERSVHKGVFLEGERFVFSVAKNREEALEKLNKKFFKEVFQENGDLDYLLAKKSLQGLVVEKERGLYAGLPWFFHFWQRDEAISLKALLSVDKNIAKSIFLRLLREGLKKGPGGVVNIDALGWTFKRAEDFLPLMTSEEKDLTRRKLKKYIEEFLWAFTEKDFAVNRPYETWMDSLERSGARIELQAMRLNMYKMAADLSKRKSEEKIYRDAEMKLLKKVRKTFFDGSFLYDGYYPRFDVKEKTVRPNIFIAAYIYPDLLKREEWVRCFDNTLPLLWLNWGGLSTLDKNSSQFKSTHTGESPESYHQGDSWFFLNNLAAIVLYRTDKRRYFDYISKILNANREEIMWKGVIGCHAEVSSASHLESRGCVNQAWSSAMYMEARKEIRESDLFE